MPNLNSLPNHLTAALPPYWDLNKDINDVMDVDSKETALSFACSMNNLPLVTALLQAGANPNVEVLDYVFYCQGGRPNYAGLTKEPGYVGRYQPSGLTNDPAKYLTTPLFIAFYNRNFEIFKALVENPFSPENKADLNTLNGYGWSALTTAAKWKGYNSDEGYLDLQFIKCLLQNNADLTFKMRDKRQPDPEPTTTILDQCLKRYNADGPMPDLNLADLNLENSEEEMHLKELCKEIYKIHQITYNVLHNQITDMPEVLVNLIRDLTVGLGSFSSLPREKNFWQTVLNVGKRLHEREVQLNRASLLAPVIQRASTLIFSSQGNSSGSSSSASALSPSTAQTSLSKPFDENKGPK